MRLLKISLLLAAFLGTTSGQAQTNVHADSLFTVKKYLQAIISTVNMGKAPMQRITKLDSLIKLGTKQKAVFERNLKQILNYNDQEYITMSRSFNFILQSAILLKTDLKGNNYKSNKSAQTELIYLNKNVPLLMDKINRCCLAAQKPN